MSDDFRNMLPMDSPKAVDDIYEIIKSIVREEIRKAKFNRMIPAEVVSVGVGTVDVQLLTDGVATTISGLANNTGTVLNISDEVYVELINGASSNMHVAIKK